MIVGSSTPPGSEGKRLCVNTGREVVFYVQWLAFLDLIISLGTTPGSKPFSHFPFSSHFFPPFLLLSCSTYHHQQPPSFSLSGSRHSRFIFLSTWAACIHRPFSPSQPELSAVVWVWKSEREIQIGRQAGGNYVNLADFWEQHTWKRGKKGERNDFHYIETLLPWLCINPWLSLSCRWKGREPDSTSVWNLNKTCSLLYSSRLS